MSHASMEANPGRQRSSTWGLKNEEYAADFCLVSRRTLTPEEHRVFRYHYMLGADWKLCCFKLEIPRGEFFHRIYRIEQKLGRIFRELEPHALFPVDEYFNGTGRSHAPTLAEITPFPVLPLEEKKRKPVKPPVLLKFPVKRVA